MAGDWFNKDKVLRINIGGTNVVEVFTSRVDDIEVFMLIDEGNDGFIVCLQGCTRVFEAVTAAKKFITTMKRVEAIIDPECDPDGCG